MKRFFKSDIFVTGIAMFSMFFGAGNVVFPLALGRYAGAGNFYSITGLLLTAVLVPFLGLASMVLFNGDYEKFFLRIGRLPALLLTGLIVAIIGPFNAMPRCIILSHSAIKGYIPGLSLFAFSIIASLIVFSLCVRESKILDILGYVLSPVLLVSLAIIIIKGLLSPISMVSMPILGRDLFLKGLTTGYNTMDLLATFFFSSIVFATLKAKLGADSAKDAKKLASMTFKSSVIGASLLGIIYIGASYLAAFQSKLLVGVPDDELLVAVAYNVMGSLSVIAAIAVALACLTTTIALAAIVTDFFRITVMRNSIGYVPALSIILTITAFFANYGFANIVAMAEPLLVICYPAVIVLAVVNMLYKLVGFRPVYIPFYGTAILFAYYYFIA